MYNNIRQIVNDGFFFSFTGAFLQVCGRSQETCCHENSEPQLVNAGRNMYDDKLQTSLKTLSGMYKEKAAKFDGQYKFTSETLLKYILADLFRNIYLTY